MEAWDVWGAVCKAPFSRMADGNDAAKCAWAHEGHGEHGVHEVLGCMREHTRSFTAWNGLLSEGGWRIPDIKPGCVNMHLLSCALGDDADTCSKHHRCKHHLHAALSLQQRVATLGMLSVQ